jgi:hypothetical protein
VDVRHRLSRELLFVRRGEGGDATFLSYLFCKGMRVVKLFLVLVGEWVGGWLIAQTIVGTVYRIGWQLFCNALILRHYYDMIVVISYSSTTIVVGYIYHRHLLSIFSILDIAVADIRDNDWSSTTRKIINRNKQNYHIDNYRYPI